MERKIEYLDSCDGSTSIYVRFWEPEGPPKAVLQLVHGMVEFIDRYDRFARVLADQGILVAGHDQLGHGASVKTREDWGYFADKGGNRCLLEDIKSLRDRLGESYPGLPRFILGHSMGSFLVRQYLHSYPEDKFSGAIILGTGMQPAWLLFFGYWLARLIGAVKGSRHRSPLLTQMSLGNGNKYFKPNRTPFDFLTRDEAIVDLYCADDRNQFLFTAGAYADMFLGMRTLTRKRNLVRMDKELPILIASGTDDPVGAMGKGPPALARQLESLGFSHVRLKMYPAARHELINEINYQEVDADILAFIQDQLEKN